MVARDLLGLHPLTGETPATTLVQPFLSAVSSPEPNHVVVVQPRIPHDVRQQHPVVETGVLFAQRPGQLFGREVLRAVGDPEVSRRQGTQDLIPVHCQTKLPTGTRPDPARPLMGTRSEERRVGKECRSRGATYQ